MMPSCAIKRIEVKELFGMFDYNLKPSKTGDGADKIIILYGDNGSGKTTILKTVFHLLAPEDKSGHKTYAANVPFRRFEIELMSGDIIWANRTIKRLDGTFEMGLKRFRGKDRTVLFEADDNNTIRAQSRKQETDIRDFLKNLKKLDISLYMLSDDRTVKLAGQNSELRMNRAMIDTTFKHVRFPSEEISDRFFSSSPQIDPEEIAKQLLRDSIKRAFDWVRSQTILSSSVGESSVNTLYNEILRRITGSPKQSKQIQPIIDKKRIEQRIRELEKKSKEFSQYGFLPEFSGGHILKAVIQATQDQIEIIDNVLSPYLESIEKKLEAMERVHRQVDTLVRAINNFLTHKSLVFEIHEGISFKAETGRQLSPDALSSGERHLILLFCNTLIALNRPSIFIIDEPEISLNIKWQRKLLSSLLQCVGENPVQYLFATHSIELLTKHRDKVIRLHSEGNEDQ